MASLDIVISAQVADLHAKLALAQADVRAFGAETKAAAESMRAAGASASSEMRAGLEQAAAASAGARAQMATYKSAIADAAVAQRAAASAAHEATAANEGLRLATAGTTREFIVLAHEMLQGRFSRIPGSIMVVGERMGALSSILAAITPTMYASAAAAAAFAAGLAGIAISAFKSEEALQIASHAFQLAGLSEGRAQIGQWTDAVRSLPGVSAEVAGKIVAAWAKVHDATPQLITAVLKQLPALGNDADEMAEQNGRLAESFNDLGGAGAKFLQTLNPAVKTMEDFRRAAAEGDRAGAMGILLAQLAQSAGRVTDALGRSAIAARGFGESLMLGLAGAAGGVEQFKELSESLDASKIEAAAAAVRAALATPTTKPVTAASTSEIETQGEQLREDVTKTNTQILAAQVSLWQKNLEAAKAAGEPTLAYERGLNSAKAELARAGSEQVVSIARESASAMEANDKITRVEQLEGAASVWRGVLAGDRLTADERVNVERSLNETLASLERARAEQSKANAAAQVKALTQEFEKQIEIARKGAALARSWNEAAVRFNEGAAKQSSKAWEEGFSAIDGAAKTMISDVLSRHASFGAAASAAIQKLATAWTEALAEIMLKLAAFEALRAASGIGGFIGGLAGQGANALGGQGAVAPSTNAQGGVTSGTQATGLAAILPEVLAKMLGIGRSVSGGAGAVPLGGNAQSGGPQQLLVTGVTKLTQAMIHNTTNLATDTSGLLANTTGISGNTSGLLSSAVQSAEWIAQALGLTTATGASATAATALLTAMAANTSALVANTIAQGGKDFASAFGGGSFAVGTFSVPSTMRATVHQGEIIVPRNFSDSIRSGEATLSGPGGGGAGGGANVAFNINANDARSFVTLLNNPTIKRALTQVMQSGLRNNPSIA